LKILIINGNPKAGNIAFDGYLRELTEKLERKGNSVSIAKLRELRVEYCTGCYSCWLKTPGVCAFKDDTPGLLKEFLKADLAVFASPVIMGFISALLKSFQEKLITLVLPYFFVLDDRLQHVPRYEKYPATVLLLEKEGAADKSPEIIENIFRSARTRKLLFTRTMDTGVDEVANELNNI